MKKISKSVISSLLAVTMTAPAMLSFAAPLTANAETYEILEESTFEKRFYPWRTITEYPARQNVSLDEGALHCEIVIPEGAEKSYWDLGIFYPHLSFRKGETYHISFRAKANRSNMELISFIGNEGTEFAEYCTLKDGAFINGPHDGDYDPSNWGNPAKLTTEYQTFSGTYVPNEDHENVSWFMEYALDRNGYGGNAQQGDEIWFDDFHIESEGKIEKPCVLPPAPTLKNYFWNRDYWYGGENTFISVNQLGYYPWLTKYATLCDNKGNLYEYPTTIDLTGRYEYEIVDAETEEVKFTGMTGAPKKDYDSGDTTCRINFTKFQEPGVYYIRIKGKEWRSQPFRIDVDIYQEKGHDLLTDALNYFYQNRAGMDIENEYITSGDKENPAHEHLSHPGGHKSEEASVLDGWEGNVHPSSSKIRVDGGWYNGSDFAKDLVSGGSAVWMLQNLYERALRNDQGAKFADGSGTVVVPETGNNVPDILDECRYELDYMAKMKVAEDELEWDENAGLYYHAVQDEMKVRLASKPWDYEVNAATSSENRRVVEPPTFAATLSYAAAAAQAARLWVPYDTDYAKELLQSAKDAYAAYEKHYYEYDYREYYPNNYSRVFYARDDSKSQYVPSDRTAVRNPYRDDNVKDDAYRAACELFISAKEMEDGSADEYFEVLSGYEDAFVVPARIQGGENLRYQGSVTMLNWGNTAAAGTLSLALHPELLDEDQQEMIYNSIIYAADIYLGVQGDQVFGVPYENDNPKWDPTAPQDGFDHTLPTGYELGSNGMILHNMIAMAYAYDLSHDPVYMKGITNGMDYLLGNNPLSLSFITGYGTKTVENPSHMYWAHSLDSELPAAPDGVIVSGPNAGAEDQLMRSLGFTPFDEAAPSMRCYADFADAWSVNTVSADYNAPLAWIAAFMQEKAPDAVAPDEDDDEEDPATTPIVTVTTEKSDTETTTTASGTKPDTTPSGKDTTTLKSDPKDQNAVWGDVNCDGGTDVSDAVLLARFLNEDKAAKITDQGQKNANVIKGDLDSDDISGILLCIARIISKDQLPLEAFPK